MPEYEHQMHMVPLGPVILDDALMPEDMGQVPDQQLPPILRQRQQVRPRVGWGPAREPVRSHAHML